VRADLAAPQQAEPPDDGVRRAAANVISAWDAHGTAISLRGWIDILRQRLAETPAPAAPQQAARQQAEPWIPCSERMPERYADVWVYCASNDGYGPYMERAIWRGDEWWRSGFPGRVTHWMPLPAGPSGEGGA
jgi:hypothetical protein